MRFLVDTNVLTCLAQPNHAQHALVLDALAALAGRGDEACIVPQNVYEFWVVSTRPREQNGLGLDAAQVKAELARMTDLFRMVRDERAIYRTLARSRSRIRNQRQERARRAACGRDAAARLDAPADPERCRLRALC